ncbi:MAG TPA: hypothetical protein VN153_05815 [Tahibacter sp.]|nr:hypothetical protein [Tahibacter sp.]
MREHPDGTGPTTCSIDEDRGPAILMTVATEIERTNAAGRLAAERRR